MRADALDRAAAETGAGAVFLVLTLQNPTNAMMSAARRAVIVAVARHRDLLLVEDDVYGHVLPARPAPLKALAPERTIHFTGISKSLAGGLRVGWIWAPASWLDPLADALYAMTLTRPPLPLEIARAWIEDGTAERLITWQGEEIQARNALLAETLGDWPFSHHPFGFHALLDLFDLPAGWPAESFAAAAARARHYWRWVRSKPLRRWPAARSGSRIPMRRGEKRCSTLSQASAACWRKAPARGYPGLKPCSAAGAGARRWRAASYARTGRRPGLRYPSRPAGRAIPARRAHKCIG